MRSVHFHGLFLLIHQKVIFFLRFNNAQPLTMLTTPEAIPMTATTMPIAMEAAPDSPIVL